MKFNIIINRIVINGRAKEVSKSGLRTFNIIKRKVPIKSITMAIFTV
jgi:hypothetical protein